MRCASDSGGTWTIARVRELRERLGIAAFNPKTERSETISADEAAQRLGISIPSLHRLIRKGILPASQAMPSAPWQIPATALKTEAVWIGVREIVSRRPHNFKNLQDIKILRLPGM
jgi:Helix-turn-helix domain